MKRLLWIILAICMLALCMQGCNEKEEPTPATIVFDKTSAVMEKNEVLEINALVAPEGQVYYWYSTNPTVARVIYGKVVALSPGNAAVIAFTDGGVIASCNILVVDESIPLLNEEMEDYFDYEITYGEITSLDAGSVVTAKVVNSNECKIHIEVTPKVEGYFKDVRLTLKLSFEQIDTDDGGEQGDGQTKLGWQPIGVSIDLDENGYGSASAVIQFLNVAIPKANNEYYVAYEAERPVELKEKMIYVMKGYYNKDL